MLTVTFLAQFDPDSPTRASEYFTMRSVFQDQSTAELLCPPGTHHSYADGSAAYTIIAMLGAQDITIPVSAHYALLENPPAALGQLTRVMCDAGYWPVDFTGEDSGMCQLAFCYSPDQDVLEAQLGSFNDMFGRPGL